MRWVAVSARRLGPLRGAGGLRPSLSEGRPGRARGATGGRAGTPGVCSNPGCTNNQAHWGCKTCGVRLCGVRSQQGFQFVPAILPPRVALPVLIAPSFR